MEPDCNRLSERILQFTLEIIYLLTGEDDIVAKKTVEDGRDPVMVPLRSMLIPESKNEEKILEITKKITDLLTAQSGKRSSDNIRIKEEIKREEKELQPFTSPEGSSFGSPPERCSRPLYSQDSAQEDDTIPHQDQDGTEGRLDGEEEVMGMKVVIKKEEDLYGRDDPDPLIYDEITEAVGKEKPSPGVRRGGNNGWISSEGRLVISADYYKEDNGMAQFSSRKEKSFMKKQELISQQRGPSFEKPFTCSVCEKSFINKSRLVQHVRIHTGIKPCPCYICGKAFIDKSQLNRHQKIHTGERPFSCPQCGKRFPSKGNRDKHMRVHTDKISNRNVSERSPRPLYIRDLTKEDHTIPHRDQGEEVMGIKIVVIEEEEPYSMNVQSTKNNGNRKSNSKEGSSLDVSAGESNGWISPEGPVLSSDYNTEDNGMSPYSSRDCVKPSIRTHELIVHERVPTIDKPFSCSECDKSFINKSRLVQHLRIHTGEKPFSCAVCGKSFIDKSQLNRHQIVHTGEKPYSCPECGKRFPSKGNRDKHMRIHTGEKPFPCPECGKCFAQKVTLLLHQRKHSAEGQ